MASEKVHKKRKDMSRKELALDCRSLVRRNRNMLDTIDTLWPDEKLSPEIKNLKKKMIRATILSTAGMLNHVAEILNKHMEGG